MRINAEFPEKLQFLFRPYRYKVARGGRGSAKSWSFARALLLLGIQRPLRILCAREVQLSIKQSVHKLLKDQISLLGLEHEYTVYDADIRGRNGTEFAFTGLSTLTVDTIKSFEGIDICWVEEGQVISKQSWDILIPTIRKETPTFTSEIWISYNPELDTDETHARFTLDPPKGCYNQEINWRDNPWFSDVMNEERLHCLATAPDDYDNIWEGKCRPAVEGAIYFKEIQEAELQGRVCNVPYDPMLKVHVTFDLGGNNAMAIGMIQKHTSDIRFIDYVFGGQMSLDKYSEELKRLEYNWGKVYLPHDGFATRPQTGKTDADVLRALGWDVVDKSEIVQMGVEQGIRHCRFRFRQFYFDKTKCKDLIEAARRYRRLVNTKTQAEGSPLHDQWSNGADMLRYAALNSDHMTNKTKITLMPTPVFRRGPMRTGTGGWMAG